MTQARENVASAEAGSASENTAVSLNKNHRGEQASRGSICVQYWVGRDGRDRG